MNKYFPPEAVVRLHCAVSVGVLTTLRVLLAACVCVGGGGVGGWEGGVRCARPPPCVQPPRPPPPVPARPLWAALHVRVCG